MAAPFTAVANSNEPRISSLAQMIFAAICDHDYGRLIEYAEFRRIIFENPQGYRGRSAILQAKRRLLVERSKLLVNVKGRGYQFINPNEHLGVSKRVEHLARRRQRAALAIVVNVEEEKLTEQERQQHHEQALRLRLKLALDKTIARAVLVPSTNTIVIPAGRRLADLLAEAAPSRDEGT